MQLWLVVCLLINNVKHIRRVTQETATIRNKMMLELADDIAIGYANPKGKLDVLINNITKPIMHL